MTDDGEVRFVGKQTIAEFSGCQNMFRAPRTFKKHAIRAAIKAGATVKSVAAFRTPVYGQKRLRNSIAHVFSPSAITVVVVLAESHIAIHTWPELNFIAVDIFTCGQKTINKRAIEYLRTIFKPKRVDKETFRRKVRVFN